MRLGRLAALGASAAMALSTGGAASAAERPIRLSHITARDSPWDKGALRFADLVAKATKGRIEVKVFPQSQLANGNQKAELEMLQSGVLDMTWDSPIILASYLDKRFDVFNLPWLYPSMDVANEVADGPMGELAYKWLSEKGIVGLGIGVNGYRELTNSKRPISTPDDMKGIKFRVAGTKLYLETFKLLGANAVTMSFGEVFTALQQGVIDGQENPYSNIESQNMHTVQKHITESNHGYIGYVHTINNEFYESLPSDVQECVDGAAEESATYNREIAADLNEEAKQTVVDAKTTQITELTDQQRQAFKDAVVPSVWEQYADVIGQDLVDELLQNQ